MAAVNWRTINIDLLDPESSANFSTASLSSSVAPVSAAEVQSLAGQVKQLLRGGDTEGALRGALENAPYGGDGVAKVRIAPPPLRYGIERYHGDRMRGHWENESGSRPPT